MELDRITMPDGIAPGGALPHRPAIHRKRINVLRWRRGYLRATAQRLRERIHLNEAKIAQIDAELAELGATSRNSPPRPRNRSPHFAHGELPRRVLDILRGASGPLHIREVAAAILAAKGLDPTDRTLADWTVKHARKALGGFRDRGLVRLIGKRPERDARWTLADESCAESFQESGRRFSRHTHRG